MSFDEQVEPLSLIRRSKSYNSLKFGVDQILGSTQIQLNRDERKADVLSADTSSSHERSRQESPSSGFSPIFKPVPLISHHQRLLREQSHNAESVKQDESLEAENLTLTFRGLPEGGLKKEKDLDDDTEAHHSLQSSEYGLSLKDPYNKDRSSVRSPSTMEAVPASSSCQPPPIGGRVGSPPHPHPSLLPHFLFPSSHATSSPHLLRPFVPLTETSSSSHRGLDLHPPIPGPPPPPPLLLSGPGAPHPLMFRSLANPAAHLGGLGPALPPWYHVRGYPGLGLFGLAGLGFGPGKRKKSWTRAVFSNLQRKGLEKRFQMQKYITKPDRRQLAASLGLTDAQVKVWFQNRRMKWRHQESKDRRELSREGSGSSTQQMMQGSADRAMLAPPHDEHAKLIQYGGGLAAGSSEEGLMDEDDGFPAYGLEHDGVSDDSDSDEDPISVSDDISSGIAVDSPVDKELL